MGNSIFIGRVGGLAVALGVGIAIAATPWIASAEPSDQGSQSTTTSTSTSESSHRSPRSADEKGDKKGETGHRTEKKPTHRDDTSRRRPDPAASARPAAAATTRRTNADTSVAVRPTRPAPVPEPATPDEPPLGMLVLAAARRPESKSELVADEQQTLAAITQQSATNSAPVLSYAQPVGKHDATGLVRGTVVAEDPDGDPLTVQVTGKPANGTVAVTGTTGAYSYTPHQAARLDAYVTPRVDTDTFTVGVSDGQQTVTTPVQVNVKPARYENTSPTGVGTNPTAALVSGDGTRLYVANTGSNSVSVINTATGQRLDANPNSTSMDIAVGSSPSALAIIADGSRLFVANSAGNSVSVIGVNAAANSFTRIDARPTSSSMDIAVGSAPSALALGARAADGTQMLYVANRSGNSVSVIRVNAAANTYTRLDANPTSSSMDIAVGSAPSALALSADGARLYVANRSSNSVSMIRIIAGATTAYQRTDLAVGSGPSALALGPAVGGVQSLYVTNATSGTVSVIQVSPNTFQRVDADPMSTSKDIMVGPAPSSVTVSPDGSLAYVANGDDTVSVIMTKTNTVFATVTIDGAAEFTGGHVTALGLNGTRLYTTDAVDRTVRALDLITVNTPPTSPGTTIPSSPDAVTGTVTGRINVADADDDRLTFTVTAAPAKGGSLSVNSQTGAFTYTPSQAARDLAAGTAGFDFDSFSISVSDGVAATSTSVTVQVAPTVTSTPTAAVPIRVGSGPSGSAVSSGRTYVINYDSNDVTVVNTATNQVLTTLQVGAGPLSVVAAPGRARVYVGNSLANTVSVINSSTNTVVGTIEIPVQSGVFEPEGYPYAYDNRIVEVAASGSRVYVNATDGSVYVIDTVNDANRIVSTFALGVFNDLEANSAGTRLYGTSAGGLTVIDSSTGTAAGVRIGPVWDLNATRSEFTNSVGNVAVSPDGNRAYVTYGATIVERGVGGQTSGSFIVDSWGQTWMATGGYSAVAVIDTRVGSATYNKEVAKIIVPLGVHDVAVSPDNARVYVTSGDGRTVSVIDTATNVVATSFITDETRSGGRSIDYFVADWYYVYSVPSFTRYITVDPVSGKILVADYTDGTLYVVTSGGLAV